MTYLTVYELEGEHYATRYFQKEVGDMVLNRPGVQVKFTVTHEGDLETLHKKAKDEATKRGITSVVSLM